MNASNNNKNDKSITNNIHNEKLSQISIDPYQEIIKPKSRKQNLITTNSNFNEKINNTINNLQDSQTEKKEVPEVKIEENNVI